MKKIYILSSCDEWKSYSTMNLIMASTSITKIKSEIIKQIKEGNIEYNRVGSESKTEQIKDFKEDLKKYKEDFAFNNLKYGFVNIVNDGEKQ